MTGDSNSEKNSEKNSATNDKKTAASESGQVSTGKAKTQAIEASGTKSDEKKKSSLTLKLFLLLVIVLLAALTIGGYFAWQQWQFQQQRLEALEAQAAAQNTQVKKLSDVQFNQAGDQSARLEKLKTDQEQIQQRLDSYTSRLRALAGTSRDDWLLAEARYLLRLASQRLLVERGTGGAQALLESADKVLQSVEDTDIQKVRDAIANDIIALKLAKTVDRQGIYAKLSALKIQIQALPSMPSQLKSLESDNLIEDKVDNTGSQSDDDQPATWYQPMWQSVKKAFGKLSDNIQIENHSRAPELLLTGKQRAQTLNNLLLMLEQAQFSLLHEEAGIYSASLQQALDWWQSHFVQYSQYEVIYGELKQLQQINIRQELPSLSGSSEILTDYIDRFHRLNDSASITEVEQAPLDKLEPVPLDGSPQASGENQQ